MRWRQTATAPVVFTNGVFDLLHAGHVAVLEGARAQGASLIVGLNSDISVRGLGKGSDRPLMDQHERARLVGALRVVDRVVLFDEPTPARLIEALAPDVLVKGGDYTVDQIVGADTVIRLGGRVAIIPVLPGHSTTRLLERIRAAS